MRAAKILSIGRGLSEHYYDQDALLSALKALWGHQFHNPARLEQLHRNVLVGGRHLAFPIERYQALESFTDCNRAFIDRAVDLGARAILAACEPLGVGPEQIDQLFFVSSTGIATPSIDARLVNRLGLRADVRRTPIFGLGCMAGAGGLARLADALRPDQLGVLLSVELCSLTLQRRDLSIPNLISSGLFGDGAAAAVVVGAEHPLAETNPLLGPEIVDARSVFYRDTEQVMGWEIGSEGFRVVLSADVPKVVERHVRSDIEAFLSSHDLELEQIASIVAHPGGPRVLEALQAALGLDDDALALSWKTLRELGNLSSASVLMVLGETMTTRRPAQGTPGLLFAMGPGFCSELLLLDW